MREFKRLFSKDTCQFLLFFDFLFVKDSPELIQRVARVSIECGEVLMRVFAHVNTPRRNGRFGCACRIALGGDGKNGREPFHVVAFSCAVRAVCEFTVGKAAAACAVGGAVLYVPIGKRSRCECILIGRRLTCDDGSLEVGVLIYMNTESICACVDAYLSCGALPAGVDLPFAVGGADVGIFGIDLPAGYGCADVEARRGVLFSVVVFFLQALDVEIAADLHIDLFARCLRSDDVGICARGHGEFFFCGNSTEGSAFSVDGRALDGEVTFVMEFLTL